MSRFTSKERRLPSILDALRLVRLNCSQEPLLRHQMMDTYLVQLFGGFQLRPELCHDKFDAKDI